MGVDGFGFVRLDYLPEGLAWQPKGARPALRGFVQAIRDVASDLAR